MNSLNTSEISQDTATTTSWFRSAAPYIHAHRGATFVVALDGETLAVTGFEYLLHDLAILTSLGIKLVVVFGARPQIEAACLQENIAVHYHQGLRITDENSLKVAKAIIGELRLDIEAKLSFNLPHTPMADSHIHCVSGNLVTARPIGIVDGVDLGHSGEVRRIDTATIHQQLANGNLVLLPPLGYSPTGEIFNVSAESIATAVATSLQADKLIFIGASNQQLPREMTLVQAKHQADQHPSLKAAISACEAGVKRVHILDRDQDGALLQELFSRDGAGTLVSATSFETLRQATIEDVSGILELIEPLEQAGVLVKRSRELLEIEIEHFMVMERDGGVIACAALYPSAEGNTAELACLAVSPNYRDQGRGEQLLSAIAKQAEQLNLASIYVLSTQTAHWFIERGFVTANIEDLPVSRQAMYNYHRNSKVFIKTL